MSSDQGPSAAPSHQLGRRRRPLVPNNQRKRVKAACVSCRNNKLKCDGTLPCQRCQKTKSSCNFGEASSVAQSISPGLPKSPRERLLEAILARHNIDVSRELQSLGEDVETYVDSTGPDQRPTSIPTIESQEHREQLTQKNRYRETSYDLRQGSRNRRIRGDDDASSVVLEHVPSSQTYVHDESRTFFDGGFSAWAFFDSVHQSTTGRGSNRSSSGRDKTAYRHFMTDFPEVLFSDLRPSLLSALPPREVLNFLSSTFFRYSQSNFFFVHPMIFNRKLDAFLAGTHEFDLQSKESSRRPVEFTCVLFMVLALGSQFADLEQQKVASKSAATVNISDISSLDPTKFDFPTPARNPGWRFYRVSRRLLADVVSSCSMTSIQACALQGTFLITTSAHDIAYNVWGLAMRMSVNMGLHKSIGEDVLHPFVRELRNRLWWSIYTLDRLFSFWMGRPTMFDDAEIDTPFPEDLTELKVEQPTGSVDGQVALIKLCRIMGLIVKKIYSSSSGHDQRVVINMASLVALQGDLERWKSELPATLALKPTSSRGAIHLHLCQQHAVMLLTRVALSHAAAASTTNNASQQQPYKTEFLRNVASDCIRAATRTIELLSDLRQRGLICRFSCHDPIFCTAALCVLLLGVKIERPSSEMKRIVLRGLSILRQLGEGSETAAASLVDLVRGFEPYFKEETCLDLADRRTQGRQAWEAWMQQSPTSADSLLTTHRDTSTAPTMPLYSPQSVLERTEWTNGDNIEQEGTGEALYPDYQHLAFDPLMDTWTVGGPFWFSDLDHAFQDFETINQPF